MKMMNTEKKRIWRALAVIVMLVIVVACVFTGCGAGGTNPTEPTPAVTTSPSTETTEATGTAGGTDETTVPTEDAEATEPSTEATEPGVPDDTEPTEDVEGTEPTETQPQPTEDVEVTTPPTEAPTEKPTEAPATEPTTEPTTAPTEAEKPAHVHDYKAKVVEATCSEDGYTVHTCSCGDTYKDSTVKAKGHSYSSKVVEPTTESKGYTLHTCSKCGDSYKDNYTDKLPEETEPAHEHKYTKTNVDATCVEAGHYLYECECGYSYKESNGQTIGEHNYELVDYKEATPEEDGYAVLECAWCGKRMTNVTKYEQPTYETETLDAQEVAKAVAKYINQFRAEQGATQLTWLSGMSQVAQYRSVQLTENFAHDTSDEREAHAYYQYGRYVDLSEYGGDPAQNYYTSDTGEAIGKIYNSNKHTADELGEDLARLFLNSSGHWAYVGSSKNSYIGVGCTKSGATWYVCVLVGAVNYG